MYQLSFTNIPACLLLTFYLQFQSHGNPDDDTTSSSSEDDSQDNDMNGDSGSNGHAVPSSSNDAEPMDEDEPVEPGWTVVRTRRKK